MKHRPLGEILIEQGAVTEAQLREAKPPGSISRRKLGLRLIEKGFITHGDIAKALSLQSGRSYVPPELLRVDRDRVRVLGENNLAGLRALPIYADKENTFAVADPSDLGVCMELEQLSGRHAHIVVTDEDLIEPALAGSYVRGMSTRYADDVEDRRDSRRVPVTDTIDIHYVFRSAEGEQLFERIFVGTVTDLSREGAKIEGGLPGQREDDSKLVEPGLVLSCRLTCEELLSDYPVYRQGTLQWVKWDSVGEFWGELGIHWLPGEDFEESTMDAMLLKQHQREAEREE